MLEALLGPVTSLLDKVVEDKDQKNQLARDIANQASLNEIIKEEIWPGPAISTTRPGDELDDAIRAQARTIYHPAGTCRMDPIPMQLSIPGFVSTVLTDCASPTVLSCQPWYPV